MSFAIGQAEFNLRPTPPLHKHSSPSRHHRRWKRRRLKSLTVHSHLNPTPSPFYDLFHTLLPQFPFASSTLSFIAPTLGLASGLALYFSSNPMKNLPNPNPRENLNSYVGEWILFTSPTPFNRFVTLRCPSICFPGGEMLEDVNERLVTEDRHFVRMSSGRMVEKLDGEGGAGESLVYQRVCVSTEDGGVLALDWPVNLDLEEERGLDTTVVIVPGTAEGSDERSIKLFVAECLRRGLFPVVMNPRGCARSPLTTARLFTAADSDDISTAVQFINKKRPWTTLVGVGWGFGANMLTKYLAELGERTPLTAAMCIDNPFDLEETARSPVHQTDFGQMHTSGLISILQRNKELFQGRGKRFDVEKALSASSVRDFEQSISMLSYGFDSIEDFYEQSSTRYMVGSVKVPVLFIQNDGGTIPLLSVPRNLIAANPYTSLLLCSYSSNKIWDPRFMSSWCHDLTLEWLTAVELGLLKGRHPILKDVDLTINPSKGLALIENESSSKDALDLTNGHPMYSTLNMYAGDDAAASILRSTLEESQLPTSSELEKQVYRVNGQSSPTIDAEIVNKDNNSPDDPEIVNKDNNSPDDAEIVNKDNNSPDDAEIVNEDNNSPDDERGQVVASAQLVINMLDVTMPDILSDEGKKKVLSAVGQGETIMKALQDAVPEDVRGNLTAAVSGILQSQGSDLKLGKLINLDNFRDLASGLKSKVLQIRQSRLNVNGDGHISDKNMSNDVGAVMVDNSSEKPPGFVDIQDQSLEELQNQSSENYKKPDDIGIVQSTGDFSSKSHDVQKGNLIENEQLSTNRELVAEKVSEMNVKSEFPSQPQEPGGTEDISAEPKKEADGVDAKSEFPSQPKEPGAKKGTSIEPQTEGDGVDVKSEFPSQPQEPGGTEGIFVESEIVQGDKADVQPDQIEDNKNKQDSSTAENKASEAHHIEDESLASSPAQVAVSGTEGSQKEEKQTPSVSSQNAAAPPISFNVSQAFEALTGFDDSSQVAVSSVFSAIEDMIDQLEVEKDKGNEDIEKDKSEVKGLEAVKEQIDKPSKSERPDPVSAVDDSLVPKEQIDKPQQSESPESVKKPPTKSPSSLDGTIADDSLGTKDKFGLPIYSTNFSYGDPLHKQYLKRLLKSKTRKAEPSEWGKMMELYLKYIPEEGRWKLSEERTADGDVSTYELSTPWGGYDVDRTDLHSRSMQGDDFLEPSYVILDSEKQQDEKEEQVDNRMVNEDITLDMTKIDHSMTFIKSFILECLNVEVGRRANMEGLELKLARELEQVADAVCLEVEHRKLHMNEDGDNISDNLCTLDGQSIINVISSAYQDTQYLKGALPVGVVVGSTLAALGKLSVGDFNYKKHVSRDQLGKSTETVERNIKEIEVKDVSSNLSEDENVNNRAMVGAVTAALGASALFVHQQITDNDVSPSEYLNDKFSNTEPSKIGEMPDRAQNDIVTSLAEKAMSIASPVVPTKGDGQVDHERLVAMLTELGQKGGALRLVGKFALLLGGIRGAMSLTDKLITFLRLADRSLFQRIFGFGFMVLLLWAPVLVPLLPSLMQSWATHAPLKIVELACVAGLYVSITIMVTLWGKRVRNYDDPLQQYGLDLASVPKFQNFLQGLVGGSILVVLIHSLNSLLGCVHLCWPTTLCSSSSETVTLFRSYGRMFLLIVQGIATAAAVATVEELLFRSWLPQEIGADLGYHRGLIISGLVFALCQRSTWEIPGLWLLSLSLAGVRERNQGSLSLPIGLRTGILASNFVLKRGGFLTRQSNLSLWITGGHLFQPFSGIVGVAFSVVLAIVLYPEQPIQTRKVTRAIKP